MGSGAIEGGGDPAFADAHRAMLADRDIQFDLPQYAPPKPPAWLEPLLRFLDAISPAFVYIFWGCVAIGVLLILWLIVRRLTGVVWIPPWRKKEIAADNEWQPDADAARTLLSEADRLASAGDYDGAVHLLLRRSVEDIAERIPDFLIPSLTARDIAAAPSLPDHARGAFGRIAGIVEGALFARRPVGQSGWLSAREAYKRFAFSESWQGQAA